VGGISIIKSGETYVVALNIAEVISAAEPITVLFLASPERLGSANSRRLHH
jgi:hypothetical protein